MKRELNLGGNPARVICPKSTSSLSVSAIQRTESLSKIDKLSVRWIADTDLEKLADMAGRNMKFAATVQDGVVWLADDSHNIEIEVKTLMRRGEPVF